MNIEGTFYGCHNLKLFLIVCQKIAAANKEFILISSGSSAEKIFNYCLNIKQLKEWYIYCYNKEKYSYLYYKFPKLKEIYNQFNNLKEKLHSLNNIKMENIKSSNLIYFEDYKRIYIKLHFEFIRKYILYKLLKANNFNEKKFIEIVKGNYIDFLPTAYQLFPNKEEIINFFKKHTNENIKTLNEIFYCKEDIKSYIYNYTLESFYYRYLNKFLREGDFNAFRVLSSHISKFIYFLYEYRRNQKNQYLQKIFTKKNIILYRVLYMSIEELEKYYNSIGRVICYPSFTSTSIIENGFVPKKYNQNDVLVKLVISLNNSKSAVSIREFSKYKDEEEYLFLPFSFFKIMDIIRKNDQFYIYLIAVETDKPIEELFLDFINNETDNLDPEGLDILLLINNNEKIIFNPSYLFSSKVERTKKVRSLSSVNIKNNLNNYQNNYYH